MDGGKDGCIEHLSTQELGWIRLGWVGLGWVGGEDDAQCLQGGCWRVNFLLEDWFEGLGSIDLVSWFPSMQLEAKAIWDTLRMGDIQRSSKSTQRTSNGHSCETRMNIDRESTEHPTNIRRSFKEHSTNIHRKPNERPTDRDRDRDFLACSHGCS